MAWTEEDLCARMGAIRDQLIEAIEGHEREHHGGAICNANRVNAAAYLVHVIGFFHPQHMDAIAAQVYQQHERCKPDAHKVT